MIDIKVKLLTDTAQMPTKAHDTDACFDIYADSAAVIEPGQSEVIHTGFATSIPEGYFCPVYDRSSMGVKKHLRLCNSVGIIDSHYRGEWLVALHNDGAVTQVIGQGDRIAQFAIQEVPIVTLTRVEELDETERGAGGFGSTGV